MINIKHHKVDTIYELYLKEVEPPFFSEPLRKNDAIFLYGALCEKPFVFTYEPQVIEVVCGPSCCKEKEIKIVQCKRENVPIRERRGGGGTVVLARGMVVTIIVLERRDGEKPLECFDKIHTAMINILSELEIKGVEKRGFSDLAIGDKKILGSSLYLGSKPSLFYYQSSLLVDVDLSLFDKYLYHPLKEPEYRMKRTHSQFCTTLLNAGYKVTPEEVIGAFSKLSQYIIA